MLELSQSSHLLEQKSYKYQLQDVAEPVLYRDAFNYEEAPKIPFNHRRVPMAMPEDIWITDTTFRDGQQAMDPFSVEQIVTLYKLMSRLSGPKGIIRQSEFFIYSKKDREAFDRCRELGLRYPEITSWIRATPQDLEAGWRGHGDPGDRHPGQLLRLPHLQKAAHDPPPGHGHLPCHCEGGLLCRSYPPLPPGGHHPGGLLWLRGALRQRLQDLSREAGIPVKIRACDTLGLGVPYGGSTLPRCVPGIIYGLRHYADVPARCLEWHGHNDFHLATANAAHAWMYGASAVNCTLLGIGERTGNVPLESMVFQYAGFRGTLDGMDTTAITDIARYFQREIGYNIPENAPFVGRNFNVTRAGIHADGLLKDEEIYNIFDTKTILDRPASVMVSKTSGLAGIAYWINENYGLAGDAAIAKNDPLVAQLKAWVDDLYDSGRQSSMSRHELEQKLQELAPGRFSA